MTGYGSAPTSCGALWPQACDIRSADGLVAECVAKEAPVSVATFHDADGPGAQDAFERWRREHPEGYFLNHGSPSDMVVHWTDCSRLIVRESRSLTSYKKVRAESIDELEVWASQRSSTSPGMCRTCSPRT